MTNFQKAQTKIKKLARWLDSRDWPAAGLERDFERAQADIDRITERAIDGTLRNLTGFIERAQLDSVDSEISARHRQMARTDLKRLLKTKNALEGLQ